MIACHDMVECVSGDIINYEGISKEEKELKAKKE